MAATWERDARGPAGRAGAAVKRRLDSMCLAL